MIASGNLDKYAVQYVPTNLIRPSPENDDLYGEITLDEQMEALIESIERRGLEEPLILTEDHFILSGHRRFHAVDEHLNWPEVPCRIRKGVWREDNAEYHRDLAEYNPQRIKGVGSLIKEAMLRDGSPEDTYAAIEEHRRASIEVAAEFMKVKGEKSVPAVSDKKRPFLEAVQKVIERLRKFWPLSIRQIHYNLLNKPPLKLVPKRSRFDLEHYRYRNDRESYNALVSLLSSARYHGHVSMTCIDDPTRPQFKFGGWDSVSEFVHSEIEGFLVGYNRDRQMDQPRHIEVFAEKNTLTGILRPVCAEYYVPMSLGRGFCSIPVWRDMATRFKVSGKDAMTLIIVSDYDPEGLELADDAIRSLRDLWDLPVDGHRVAVNREQINELKLAQDFNPAKVTSSRYASFVKRTRSKKTWEVEAIDPDYLQEHVRAAIEENMDMAIYESVVASEERDCDRLYEIKQEIAGSMSF